MISWVPNLMKTVLKTTDKEVVSLDLGARMVKGVYLQNNEVKSFFIEKNNGNPVQLAAQWLKKEKLLSKAVVIAIKGQETLVRYIPFPKIDVKNLKEAFSFEISKFIPFSKEDIYYGLSVVDEKYSESEFLLFLGLGKKHLIDSLIKQCANEKLNIAKISLSNISLLNLFLNERNGKKVNKTQEAPPVVENIALLDIGFNSILLNLVKQGKPCLSREIKANVFGFLQKLPQEKDIALPEVEEYFVNLKNVSEIQDIIENDFLEILEEVKSSFDYFEVNWGGRINEAYITGGITKVDGIEEIFSKLLEIKVRRWDIFSSAGLQAREEIRSQQNMLAAALGTCL